VVKELGDKEATAEELKKMAEDLPIVPSSIPCFATPSSRRHRTCISAYGDEVLVRYRIDGVLH